MDAKQAEMVRDLVHSNCFRKTRGNISIDRHDVADHVLVIVLGRLPALKDQTKLVAFVSKTAQKEVIKKIKRQDQCRQKEAPDADLYDVPDRHTSCNPLEALCLNEEIEALRNFWWALDDRTRDCLATKFPMEGDTLSVADAARRYKISPQRVGQICREGIEALRKAFQKNGFPGIPKNDQGEDL